MSEKQRPKYPIFIPSKGRANICQTAKLFDKYGVPYRIVVEPSQVADYSVPYPGKLLVLPEDGQGLVYARNWIKDYAREAGFERHWQFDDDIRAMTRVFRGNRLYVDPSIAIVVAETFVDRYENVALASFNSEFFVPVHYGQYRDNAQPPFHLNSRCYTVFLVLNSLPNRWRRRYNEDTDMSLQVLSGGWCTVLFNAFMIMTPETMSAQGGQTDIYVQDGRLRMARQLESMWPGTVTMTRRHGRPQHHVKNDWQAFDTPLKRKPGLVIKEGSDEFGMKLKAMKTVTHPILKQFMEDQKK